MTSRHYPAVDICSLFQQQQERCAVSSVSCHHQRSITWRSGRRAAAGLQPPSHPPSLTPSPLPPSSFYATSFLLSSSLLHLLHPPPLTLVPPPFFLIPDPSYTSIFPHILNALHPPFPPFPYLVNPLIPVRLSAVAKASLEHTHPSHPPHVHSGTIQPGGGVREEGEHLQKN